jgi:hypothetical protein
MPREAFGACNIEDHVIKAKNRAADRHWSNKTKTYLVNKKSK